MASRSGTNKLKRDPTELNEASLLYRAGPLVRALGGRLPNEQDLRYLTAEHGVALATAVWVRAVQESPLHGPLVREVNSFDLSVDLAPFRPALKGYEVTVVASTLALGGRPWGAHVEEWRGWARELGFTTEAFLTDGGFGVETNARLISESLLENPHPRRIIVTYGQGTSEFRFLLEKRLRRGGPSNGLEVMNGPGAVGAELRGVRGWISVAGSFAGAASSSRAREGLLRPYLSKLKMFMSGRAPRSLDETATEAWAWKGEVPLPPGMMVTSIVGAPLVVQMPAGLRAKYAELAELGPNDGALLLSQAMVEPSAVIPVPGMSHWCEPVKLKPVFQRALGVTVRMAEALEPSVQVKPAASALENSSLAEPLNL